MFTILAAIIVLGIIVFIHEFGHFAVAKLSGIAVEKFSIGYPPTMISHKFGETEYCIGWIPFGGYVKLSGETPEEISSNPRDFRAKSPLTRIAVLFAGPFMNAVLGFILIWFVLIGYGESIPRYEIPKIGSTVVGMPAAKANIAAGDIIVKIDGDTVKSWNDMAEFIHSKPNVPISLTISRNDSLLTVVCTPEPKTISTETGDSIMGMIGIVPTTIQKKMSIFPAFIRSIEATIAIAFAVLSFLINLIIGHASLSEVGGPVMIAQIAGESARLGIWQFLMFIAALSINLALLNLFPIPPLDGGQILFTVIEGIRKKAISLKFQAIFQQITIALLLAFMLLVTV
ncbi:RIP metalloprotease RseP, partial [bacterium]